MIGRVMGWENAEVHGWALSSDNVFEEDMAKVRRLRKRQADYLNSLPTDPKVAISAARRLLHPGGAEFPDGFEEAMRLAWALVPMIEKLETERPAAEREAAIWIAQRVAEAIEVASERLEQIAEILDGPDRVERAARITELSCRRAKEDDE
ncbi:hypothetical protein [Paracoccus siganidrum]|uniref:Uncharacterized protein n=1 Tax=Paracoccus siganidrum TaxID=1276757 RepID=A0A419A4J8_9RHOB|nr:hypothetical protein [Paracoccus siganidrum]RJL09439.1 hypothetical protein D3P05_14945 [Paracoccus siganidrum]RMC38993.1 hypothetical protein C9E82_06580 [Paracoccus siganidrum]